MLLLVGEPARRSGAGYRLYNQVDGTIGFSYLTIRKPDLYLTTGRAHNGVYPLIFKVNQHVTTLSTPVLSLLDATPDDMAAVLHIYTHHVLYGAASFEEQPPTLAEMQSRRSKVLEAGLPWLVAKSEGRILGYCYATPYRPRPAYRFTVEDSVYIAEGQQGKGVGKALLHALIARCEQGPWRQMLAIVGDSATNLGSLALHQSLGFTNVGTLKAVGFKLGEWRDTHIMQRALGAGDSTRP